MARQILLLIILSLVLVFFMHQYAYVLHLMSNAHNYIAGHLKSVFSGNETGRVIRETITMLVIPLIVALIPSFLYWLIRRRSMPYAMHVVWITWVVLVTMLAMR